MEFWLCILCGGIHPVDIFECPYGRCDLDQEDNEQTQA